MHKLRLLFTTSRPISWVNTAYPFAAGYLLLGGGLTPQLFVGTLFFLIPYNLLMYGINDVFDYESDMRNPRKGGVEGAVTPKRYHPLIIWSSVVMCLPFVLALAVLGGIASTLTLLCVLFFVVAYSAKGLRFKEVPFLDSATSSLHFVGPLVYAYSLFPALPSGSWRVVGAFFAWGVASQAFGAVQDIVPDRQAGIASIATKLGARSTMHFVLTMYLAATLLTASLLTIPAVIMAAVSLGYVVIAFPYRTLKDTDSDTARRGWKQFLWYNYTTGFVLTITLIAAHYL